MTFGDFGTVTRRAALSLVAVLAPASGWLVAGEADAKKHRRKKCKKKCGICRKCKKGKCKTTAGALCGTGGDCLANRTCASSCDPAADNCPAGCSCLGTPSVEGQNRCYPNTIVDCNQVPQTCATSAECPAGSFCQPTSCGPNLTIETRCMPLCSA